MNVEANFSGNMHAWLNIEHAYQNISVIVPDGKKLSTDHL